jgi:hypothetical protein
VLTFFGPLARAHLWPLEAFRLLGPPNGSLTDPSQAPKRSFAADACPAEVGHDAMTGRWVTPPRNRHCGHSDDCSCTD